MHKVAPERAVLRAQPAETSVALTARIAAKGATGDTRNPARQRIASAFAVGPGVVVSSVTIATSPILEFPRSSPSAVRHDTPISDGC